MPPPCLYTLRVNRTTPMTSNPYAQQIRQQGKEPSKAPAPKRTYPLTIGARTYYSEEHYQEALAEFLNGY